MCLKEFTNYTCVYMLYIYTHYIYIYIYISTTHCTKKKKYTSICFNGKFPKQDFVKQQTIKANIPHGNSPFKIYLAASSALI